MDTFYYDFCIEIRGIETFALPMTNFLCAEIQISSFLFVFADDQKYLGSVSLFDYAPFVLPPPIRVTVVNMGIVEKRKKSKKANQTIPVK